MRKRFNDVTRLVEALLDRVEAGGLVTQPFARVGEFASVMAEDRFFGELGLLEAAGGLVVDRRRVDGVAVVRSIRVADPAVLYRHVGRTPSTVVASAALSSLRELPNLPKEAHALLDEVASAWSRNVSWETLRPGRSVALRNAILLAQALAERGKQGPEATIIDHRTFSRQVTGNSKSLERLQRIAVLLLRRLHPEVITEGVEDDAKVLAVLGVEKFSQPLLLSGSLRLDGQPLPNLAFVGIPVGDWRRVGVTSPTYMLLIENYASFMRHCIEINTDFDGLVVFTGGFPSQGVLTAICGLAAAIDAPVFHWGDLDPGGLRIYVHLEKSLAQSAKRLRPHLMSSRILTEYGKAGSSVGRALRAGESEGSAIADLWNAMALADPALTMEQEQLSPSRPDRGEGEHAGQAH